MNSSKVNEPIGSNDIMTIEIGFYGMVVVKQGSIRSKLKLEVLVATPVFLTSFIVAVTGMEYEVVEARIDKFE